MFRLYFFLVIALVVSIPIIAGIFLPWWGTLIVLATLIVLIMVFAPRLIFKAIKAHMISAFERQSAVLRDVTVVIHDIYEVEPSSLGDQKPSTVKERIDPDKDNEDSRYILVDFTLKPSSENLLKNYNPFQFYLVPHDANLGPDNIAEEDIPTAPAVEVALIKDTDEQTLAEQISGEAKLQIVFKCPLQLTGEVKVRYFFVEFGHFRLPDKRAD